MTDQRLTGKHPAPQLHLKPTLTRGLFFSSGSIQRLRICVAFFISGSRESSSIRLVVKSARWA
nr:MAG TPA: hypothetical protein [Caudoviricetes sp.]